MGFRVSLIATDALPLEDLLSRHGFGATNDRSDYSYRGDDWLFEGRDGWNALIEDGWSFTEEDASRLSVGGNSIYLVCDTCSMSVRLYAFADGAESFRFEHLAEKGKEHLDSNGDLPELVQRTTDEALEELALDVDAADYLFDVPLKYVGWMTGFHPESMDVEESTPFVRLETVSAEGKP
jgi:hypothetical protein